MARGHRAGLGKRVCLVLVLAGNVLVLAGCAGLLLGAAGWVSVDLFEIGISSGIRVLGTVAIAGCLSSAIGYEWLDHIENQQRRES